MTQRIGWIQKAGRSISLVLLLCVVCSITVLLTDNVSAKDWGKKCNAVIPVPVPSFSCLDGEIVPKVVSNGKCPMPEALYNRCIFMSRLGVLAKGSNSEGVDIIFSCRKERARDKTDLHEGDKGNQFYDIAVIQHDRKTGNTCFYQHINEDEIDGSGPDVPAPGSPEAISKNFWNITVDWCTRCHTNGPFVRTPHYFQNIKRNIGKDIIPSEQSITKYKIVHDHYHVFNVSFKDKCTGCHNVGAYLDPKEGMKIGMANELAVGEIHFLYPGSSNGPDSPTEKGEFATEAGLYDFMSRKVGGSEKAKAELKKLVACLAKPTENEGCMVTAVALSAPPIYIPSDFSPAPAVWASKGDFAPICNGGSGTRLPGLDLVRKFAGSKACPGNTNTSRFSSKPNFIFLVDDTSALSSTLTNYLKTQNLLQKVGEKQVVVPGVRTFVLNRVSMELLFVGETAYSQGGSNPSSWFATLDRAIKSPLVVAGP